jgi:hypothetical protein
MARSHGPFGGPPLTPLRRRPGEDQYGASQQPGGQWPPQHQQGYGDYQSAPPPAQGYHFPPPEAQPAYGYSNPQLLAAAQQWPQHGEPQPYDVAYQPYGDNDPSPFAGHAPHQHQGYADSDTEFGDGYYEEEEPRRGKRWFLIAAALIGAIGVGGALAYTYRSIVAPKRVVVTKSEPVKVKVPSAPVKVAEEPPPGPKTASVDPPPAEDPPPGDLDQGPRRIKVIPVGPGGGQSAPTVTPPPLSIPGISVYQAPPTAEAPPAPPVKDKEVVAPPGGRVVIGKPPPPPPVKEPKEEEEETAVAPPPVKLPKTAALKTPPAPRATSSSSGLGYVAVLKSAKTHMEAMTSYADLQQRYPDVLGDKSFDVQEADLSARNLGTMYRVVVGPPGSHNAASAVCAQLKAAGYVGCWVKEY